MLTYRRPECLVRMLPLLTRQAQQVEPAAEVLVVDNDPAGGAADEVGRWAASGVRYAHQPVPGISAARNQALEESTGYDALVFIDDDDLPGEGWLHELVGGWRRWECDAVTGPVTAQLGAVVDPWLLASGEFDSKHRTTGQRVDGAATNNLLLDLAAVRRHQLRFDERLGLVGGEDALFTRSLTARGGRILWCEEAQVIAPVPPERLNRRWVLRRNFRAGGSWSQMEIALAPSAAARTRIRLTLVGRSLVHLGSNGLMLTAGTALGRLPWRARGARNVASRLGQLLGVGGYVYTEYRRRPVSDAPPASV